MFREFVLFSICCRAEIERNFINTCCHIYLFNKWTWNSETMGRKKQVCRSFRHTNNAKNEFFIFNLKSLKLKMSDALNVAWWSSRSSIFHNLRKVLREVWWEMLVNFFQLVTRFMCEEHFAQSWVSQKFNNLANWNLLLIDNLIFDDWLDAKNVSSAIRMSSSKC